MVCSACRALPRLPTGPSLLHLFPPTEHTAAKLRAVIAASLPEPAEAAELGCLALAVTQADLEDRLDRLAAAMAPRERAETRCLLLPAGHRPSVADIGKVQPFAELHGTVRSAWLADLLAQGRITTHFQPIFATADRSRPFAYEALLRGVDEAGRTIGAGRIFTAATEANLLYRTDLAARLSAVDRFVTAGARAKLFINFSPTSVYDPEYCLRSTIARIDAAGIAHTDVVFEITEAERHADLELLLSILRVYRSNGFLVALDDFGVGYSTLQILDAVRPDFLKIDMSLVRDVHRVAHRALIVRNLIDLCAGLGVATLAEGIESDEELAWFVEAGAAYLQGYHLGRPAPLGR